ncbi:permease prefix domain 1-containing protein [Paenibacillus macerans]|uniref:permease prefix domain 1-containing protein n=1 Tax=Paenibacillus macerans TaxID=44252 RepID=UPI003D32070B
MNALQKHVDRLFAGYPKTAKIREMKEEIAGNLEAKAADLAAGGMSYEEAVKAATSSLTSINGLIDENRDIYVNRYRLELLQKILLYALILWIFTIPLRLVERSMLSYLLLAVVLLFGILYLVLNAAWREGALDETAPCNLNKARRRTRLVWLLWGLFILVSVLAVTAVRFGSNIWFGHQIKIIGPYQLAVVGFSYAKPFLTILIPLSVQAGYRLISKHEAGETE